MATPVISRSRGRQKGGRQPGWAGEGEEKYGGRKVMLSVKVTVQSQ